MVVVVGPWKYLALRTPIFLRFLDALHLVLASHALYTYLITNFANINFITVSLWSLCVSVGIFIIVMR